MPTAPLRRVPNASSHPPPAQNILSTGPQLVAQVEAHPSVPASIANVATPSGGAGAWLNTWVQTQGLSTLLAVCSLGSLLLFWHLVTTYRIDFYIRFANIPTPADVWQSMVMASGDSKFITNVGVSLRRIFIGFALAGILGVAIGLVIGRYRRMHELLFPALEALRPIPAIAWVPISIMLWPDNEVSIVFITFLGAFFPILLNTVSGVQAVDSVLLRAGQCLGAKSWQIMWNVVLPGAAPQIFTGLAVGMGVAWVSLIAAEMISGQFGIGYFTWESYSLIAYSDIVLGMITIGVLGLVCSWLIRIAGKLLLPWLEFTKLGGQS